MVAAKMGWVGSELWIWGDEEAEATRIGEEAILCDWSLMVCAFGVLWREAVICLLFGYVLCVSFFSDRRKGRKKRKDRKGYWSRKKEMAKKMQNVWLIKYRVR